MVQCFVRNVPSPGFQAIPHDIDADIDAASDDLDETSTTSTLYSLHSRRHPQSIYNQRLLAYRDLARSYQTAEVSDSQIVALM